MRQKRLFFIIFALSFGYLAGIKINSPIFGVLSGVIIGILGILGEFILKKTDIKSLFVLCSGLIIGFVVANLASVFTKNPIVLLGIFLLSGYLGAIFGYERGKEVLLLFKRKQGQKKLLDTSVIIDGKIAQIIESGFLEGEFIVPRFVLDELQAVADSQDPLKRNRGRRGLDVLKRMQNKIYIEETSVPEAKEVDKKLIYLAKKMNASILTCDYNLNKVAQIEGVRVLNINELTEALKPLILPGEVFYLQIVKEGKEFGQGIGYLDDGTMVIVEDGSDYLGRMVKAEVSTIHQSPSGRMIFTKVVK